MMRTHVVSIVTLAAGMVGATAVAGCSHSYREHLVVDAVMASAYRPPPLDGPDAAEFESPRYELLAGDLHCHVLPPDDAGHVSRDLERTVEIAREEQLDFVVLTPHIWSRFFMDASLRAHVVRFERGLHDEIARNRSDDVILISGFEYTDHEYGHVGMMFGNAERVMSDVSLDDANAHPEHFFERWVASGGLLVVNHPLVTPLESSIAMARADISWRPFTAKGPFPAEIAAIDRLATGFEVYNLTTTHMRDRFLQGDTDRTLRETLRRLDDEIPKRARRMTPLGGSDSHSDHLRPTTYVWSRSRTPEGIRDGIAAGRVCVRSPEACSLQVRAEEGGWHGVGESLHGASIVDVRARGRDIDIIRNGEVIARPESGAVVRVGIDGGRCTVIRARVGKGFSAPIYVNCAM